MSPLPLGHSDATSETQLEAMLAHFEPYRRAGRLLDVGFGDGQLLVAAAADGWQCWGTETSGAALASGRRRGWRVLSGDLCRIGLPESLFDVICMAHVLEYLEQPAAYLREAIRLLRPGGLLYLATTSVHAVETQPPACRQSYLQLFTASAVRLALETAGYTRERIAISSAAANRQDPTAPPRLLSAVVQQLLRATPMGERLTAFAERPH
jgi:SAM-dependent methyltransferase